MEFVPGVRYYGTRKLRIYPRPSVELVKSWINSYRRIGEYTLAGITFYARPLTRETYRFICGQADPGTYEFDLLVCAHACIWPDTFQFDSPRNPAGIASSFSANALDLSGFTKKGAEKLFNYWRDKVYDKEERNDLLIMIAFPQMTYDELDRMLADEYYRYLAAAEFRVSTQLMTATSDVFSPEELVHLLLCSREELEQRIDKAIKDQEATNAAIERQARQQQQRQPYGPRAVPR